jgi:hypothetical protein
MGAGLLPETITRGASCPAGYPTGRGWGRPSPLSARSPMPETTYPSCGWPGGWGDCDKLDELRQRAASGGHHALLELARRLAERNMPGELRDLAIAADRQTQPLILRTARNAYSPGTDVLRVCADLEDEEARHGLIRWLARHGHLDELRQRAASGDVYVRRWLAEALRRIYLPHGR